MTEALPIVDVAGVGLNATDTVIQLSRFPAFNSKMEIISAEPFPGGQVASAIVACSRWGLSTRYVGKIGDDPAANLQRAAMAREDVEAYWIEVLDCPSQSSFILVDQSTGERTILWQRDPRIELHAEELTRDWVVRSRLLHVDGHDCGAATAAARWAREAGIPVTADIDNIYPGLEALLEQVDYLISSREFPARFTGQTDLLESLPNLMRRFSCRVTAATLGTGGALAWDGRRFHYAPAFVIEPVDTTGAGDIFHAGFAYALIQGWELPRALEFSCAASALACTAIGARSGIATLDRIHSLVLQNQRHAPVYSYAQLESFKATK